MKKIIFLMLTAMGLSLVTMAQNYDDDLYYVPKKEKNKEEKKEVVVPVKEKKEAGTAIYVAPGSTVVVQDRKGNVRDVDEYNRRYDAKDNEFVMADDTLYIRETAANALEGEWIGGFEGSQDDYEYAERIIRFRNPRYAIPISSPYYWDVVYGLNSWNWNVYTDGYYAYAFPTFSNRLWWDWRWGSVGWGWGPGWHYGWGYNSWYAGNYWGWGGYWPGYWNGGRGHHHYWGGGYPGGGHWASTPVYHNTRRSEFAGSSTKGTVSARRSDYNGTATRVGSGVTSSRRVVGTRTSETTRPSGSVMTRPSTETSSSPSSSGSRNSSSSSSSSTYSRDNSSSPRSSYTPSSSSRSSSSISSGSSSSSTRSSGSVSSGGGSTRSSGGGSSRR